MPVESAVVAANTYLFFSVLGSGRVMVSTRNIVERETLLNLLALYEIPIHDEAVQTDEERIYAITANGMVGVKPGDLAAVRDDLLISPGELKSRLMKIQLTEDENIL